MTFGKTEASLLTFSLYCIQQIDSMLLCICSVIGHKGPYSLGAFFLTSSVIYYFEQTHSNYLLNIPQSALKYLHLLKTGMCF